jgi:hypothetical protein
MKEKEALIVKDDHICPIAKTYCDNECCPVGSICNVSSIDGISDTLPQPTRTMKEEIVRESEIDFLYVVDFGKNGQGITNELVLIGKRIEDLSEYYNVYMSSDSFIDAADDVYTLKFILSPKDESQEN